MWRVLKTTDRREAPESPLDPAAVYVLVPGMFHGAWCWQRVVPLLEAAGHRALAPELLGMGDDTTPLADVTLGKWADQVATVIERERTPVVLVGHSRGGVVISEVAERIPERIETLVYLAAPLLPDGASIATARTPEEGEADIVFMRPDGAAVLWPKFYTSLFYNETAPEWRLTALEHLSPEPMQVSETPIRVTPERFGRVPRVYVECVHDNAMPKSWSRSMRAALPCDVMTLETDHSPFFSDPEALVACLESIAARN